MNACNPLAAMKRLEEPGLARAHAETIAAEVGESRSDLVTRDYLDSALDTAINRVTIKISVITAAMLTSFCTIIGTIVSVFAH